MQPLLNKIEPKDCLKTRFESLCASVIDIFFVQVLQYLPQQNLQQSLGSIVLKQWLHHLKK
jgi:hypothetical protein